MRKVLLMSLGVNLLFLSLANANLLQNPGFEAGEFGNIDFHPWAIDGDTSKWAAGWSIEHFMRRLGKWGAIIDKEKYLQQTISVTPYTNYKITIPAKIGAEPGGTWYINDLYLYIDGEEINHYYGALSSTNWFDFSAYFNSNDRTTITVEFFPVQYSSIRLVVDDLILAGENSSRPSIISATAYDGEVSIPGIDDDDYVVIAFSEPTNKLNLHYWYFAEGTYIDSVLTLNNGHSWLSESENLWGYTWNERGDTMRIDLYAVDDNPPTVEVGDEFYPDTSLITDEYGNCLVSGWVTLGGSFDGGSIRSPNQLSRVADFSHQFFIEKLEKANFITTPYYSYKRKENIISRQPVTKMPAQIFENTDISNYSIRSGNLLKNPGFEDSLNDWIIESGIINITSYPFGIRNGQKAALKPDHYSSTLIKQADIEVEPNTDYKLTINFKVMDHTGRVGLGNFQWTKIYIDDEMIYYVWHTLRSEQWKNQSVVFNSGDRTNISVSIELYIYDVPPLYEGTTFDDFSLIPYDTTRPKLLSAVASDGDVKVVGIDSDDYVKLTFDKPTNKPPIERFFDPFESIIYPIDRVLKLESEHTWLDGSGKIESAIWNTAGDVLQVNLSVAGGVPSIRVGDIIRPGRCEILDECGNPILRDVVVVTGSFDPVGVEDNPIANNGYNIISIYGTIAINYTLKEKQKVKIEIFNILGQKLVCPLDAVQEKGNYTLSWKGLPGIYFIRLQIGKEVYKKKAVRVN